MHCSIAGIYTETITLNFSTTGPTRIECRAFVEEIPELPCCNDLNGNTLCQPDTGIARVVVDVLNASHPKASTWCKAGGDLNSIPELALNDMCPSDGKPKYCTLNSHPPALRGQMPFLSTPLPGTIVVL